MQLRTAIAAVTLVSLAACGGGGGGAGAGTTVVPPTAGPVTPAPAPTPAPTVAGCTLRERQDWAGAQIRDWYLFPELLPAALAPDGFASVDAYVDALTATARAQRRDRFFTYVTSIAAENAFYASGQTAGFGFRLITNGADRRVLISEAFEGTPALSANLDRGTEILAIGTSDADLRPVSAIIAAEGGGGVIAALGANTPGVTRTFRVAEASGAQRTVTIAKANYELTPISSRYGSRIIDDGGRRVGYVNLRTFISTADPALRAAFAGFRAAGVGEVIVDLRYNGGGLISTANLFGDLLGRNRVGQVYSYTVFNAARSARNETRLFRAEAEAIAPTRIAFIGLSGTASASELVMNAFIPYLRENVALIGTNTFGKPVGQVAIDREACDDRLRVVALATQNADRRGDYYDGLAAVMPRTCSAPDDVTAPLGDAREGAVRTALEYLAGRACTPISGVPVGASARMLPRNEPLVPDRPTTAQREVPGLF